MAYLFQMNLYLETLLSPEQAQLIVSQLRRVSKYPWAGPTLALYMFTEV